MKPKQTLDTKVLKPALQRVSILANEKFKGVRIDIENNRITISSENPEQEQAVEDLDIITQTLSFQLVSMFHISML